MGQDTLEIPNTPEKLHPDKDPDRHTPKGMHACRICNMKRRSEMEERYSQGWRVIDLAKRYKCPSELLHRHLEETGLVKKFAKQRKIKIDEFCDDVIRASLPLLDGKSTSKGLYIRDAIDAAKVKMKIKDSRKIEELWESVERISEEVGTGEFPKDVKKTVSRLAGVLGEEGNIEDF
jgi:hypothetical protein